MEQGFGLVWDSKESKRQLRQMHGVMAKKQHVHVHTYYIQQRALLGTYTPTTLSGHCCSKQCLQQTVPNRFAWTSSTSPPSQGSEGLQTREMGQPSKRQSLLPIFFVRKKSTRLEHPRGAVWTRLKWCYRSVRSQTCCVQS